MLTSTFCHLPGVTVGAERRLWERGAVVWGDLPSRAHYALCSRKLAGALGGVEAGMRAWAAGDIAYFASRLPVGELPRLLPHLSGGLGYLDIETTGLTRRDSVTTVVLHCGSLARLYVRGINMQRLATELEACSTLVTFNGQRFDLPFLKRDLGLNWSGLHIDLCRVLRDRGYRGGLKVCEKALGVARKESRETDGLEAIRLWRRHEAGNHSALAKLLRYNLEDALVLERLMVTAYNESMKLCPVYRQIPMPDQRDLVSAAEVEIDRLCSLTTDAQDVVF